MSGEPVGTSRAKPVPRSSVSRPAALLPASFAGLVEAMACVNGLPAGAPLRARAESCGLIGDAVVPINGLVPALKLTFEAAALTPIRLLAPVTVSATEAPTSEFAAVPE